MICGDTGGIVKLTRDQRLKICEVLDIVRYKKGFRKSDRGVIRRMMQECIGMFEFDDLPVHIRKQILWKAMESLKWDDLPEWRKNKLLNYDRVI